MRIAKLCFILGLCLPLGAQTSTFTATITDTPDAQTWNAGTWSMRLINPTPQIPAASNGVPLTQAQQIASGVMNGSGVMTGTVFDNVLLTPINTQWQITICPHAITGCQVTNLVITGSAPNLSTQLSAIAKSPRFPAGPTAFGYADAEVIVPNIPGGIYYNVTSSTQRLYSGTAWGNNGGSGGCTTAGASGFIQASNGAGGCVASTIFDNLVSQVTVNNNMQVNGNFTATGPITGLNGTSFVVNNTSSPPSGGYNFTIAGVNAVGLDAWGTGNGAGLPGVLGLFDGTNSSTFVWNTNTSDDMCFGTTVAGGNVAACTGANFKFLHTGTPVFTQIHSTTGTRFLCVDTAGNVTASATACSGT